MQLFGESVSGIGTRIQVLELGLTFDIGSCPAHAASTANTVCITHGHMDHIGQAVYLASLREMQGLPPPNFILPAWLIEVRRLGDLIAAESCDLDWSMVGMILTAVCR